MKKNILPLALAFVFVSMTGFAFAQQNFHGKLEGATIVSYSKYTGLPNFVRFRPGTVETQSDFPSWLQKSLALGASVSFRPYSTEQDGIGFTHVRYKEYVGDFPVENTMIIAHIKDDKVVSFNGDYYQDINPALSVSLSEQNALQFALNGVHAAKYKWENKDEENAMKTMTHDPSFTYFPKGELVAVHQDGSDYSASSIHLTWKFNVYAEEPLSRNDIFVDAQTGAIVHKRNLIENVDVPGSANTVYSGTQPITCDNFNTNQYRLRETGRGNGIETYNLNNSTNYTNTDFTNNSSTWNLSPPDQAATDAHWGAEMTYDYYMNVHNRNSIDDAGFALLSYVHYSNNYVNAFWDGQVMTYGDGNVSQGYTIMTGLDVCGHEISHGLTTFTANLNGGEADALNEGNSDIFGTTIEFYARPSNADWLIGADITTNGQGLRNMSDPKQLQQPDTYLGQYWDQFGEPHNNNGPFIYWYYLLCQGGSGTNDNNDNYNVTGITMQEAQFIEYRGLSVYFTPSTAYADARTYTIQAAQDLYGACSPEVISTTNAWYAVGVGAQFSASVAASFSADVTNSCTLPATVNFTNTSSNASNATWNFGDNTTSTQTNPTHTYTQNGTYSVSLSVNSACGTDSILQTNYITVNAPTTPVAAADTVSACAPQTFNLNASGSGTLTWYDQPSGGTALGTGASFTTPVVNSTTTFYVANEVSQPPGYVGPASYNFGTGGMHNNTSTQYLEFTVYQPCTLVAGDVNSGGTGTRTFTLWDSNGNQISQYPVNVTSGVQTVSLNIPLQPGSYRIGGTQMNLYRNNSGPAYPYNYNGIVSITGSSAGSGYYYYLYNWQIQPQPCASPRTPVVAYIGIPNMALNLPMDTVCQVDGPVTLSGGSPAGGTYSGTGVSNGVFDPTVSGTGTFTITYTYNDTVNGCSGSTTSVIDVETCAGISSAASGVTMAVFPNPATTALTVDLSFGQTEDFVEVSVVNTLGQQMYSTLLNNPGSSARVDINTEDWARGMYLLKVRTSSGTQVRKIETR